MWRLSGLVPSGLHFGFVTNLNLTYCRDADRLTDLQTYTVVYSAAFCSQKRYGYTDRKH